MVHQKFLPFLILCFSWIFTSTNNSGQQVTGDGYLMISANGITVPDSALFATTYCDNEIEVHFPGGVKTWMKDVTRNFRKKILIQNNVPVGAYNVLVYFIVTKSGKIANIEANSNFGYGIEDEIIRAIKKWPKWKPATNCGKKINTYQQQPITITVP